MILCITMLVLIHSFRYHLLVRKRCLTSLPEDNPPPPLPQNPLWTNPFFRKVEFSQRPLFKPINHFSFRLSIATEHRNVRILLSMDQMHFSLFVKMQLQYIILLILNTEGKLQEFVRASDETICRIHTP